MLKSLADARKHYEDASGSVPQRYKDGVARADWQGPASSDQAEANYAAGVQNAVSLRSRQAKCKAASNADWQRAATDKGGNIIGTRMKDAAPKYERNFGPIYAEIERVVPTLPARTIDPMANIDNRLKKVVETARKAAGKS